MAVSGQMARVAALLALLLTMAPALAEAAPAGTGSDTSFTPTMRPTHSVPKAPKTIPVRQRVKKAAKPDPVHS
jgi:hypothetical protein